MFKIAAIGFVCFLGLLLLISASKAQSVKRVDDARVSEMRYNQDTVLSTTKERYKKSLQLGDTAKAAEAALKLAELFYESGNFEYAMRYYLATIRLASLLNKKSLQANAYSRLGTVYLFVQDKAKSLQSLEAALELFVALNDSVGLAETWGRLGHYREKRMEYAAAFELQRKALSYFSSMHDSVAAATILENIGSIYEDLLKLDSAAYYFNEGLKYLKGKDQLFLKATLLNNLGDIERKRGDHHKGIKFTRLSLNLANQLDNGYLQKSAFRDLSKTYVELERYDSAFFYLNLAYDAQGKTFSQESAIQMSQMKTLFDIEQKEASLKLQSAAIDLLETQKQYDKWLQRLLAIGLCILLTASIWIIRLQKIRRKSEGLLYEQNATMLETKRQLAERELEHATLMEANLRNELAHKQLQESILKKQLEERSNELTALTLKIVRKNKLIEEIRGKIQSSEAFRELKDIRRLLDQHLRVDKNWEHFLELFETVHQDFYQKLSSHHGKLSASELRLCCLLRLNIPSKDIASMLGISNDSLRIARYRVHKKLNLKSGERLSQFILTL